MEICNHLDGTEDDALAERGIRTRMNSGSALHKELHRRLEQNGNHIGSWNGIDSIRIDTTGTSVASPQPAGVHPLESKMAHEPPERSRYSRQSQGEHGCAFTGVESNGCTEVGVNFEAKARVDTDQSLDLCNFCFGTSGDEAESPLDCLSGLHFRGLEAKDTADLAKAPLRVGGGNEVLELEDWDVT
ncbi:UNVERIFIED_CONTAM: hypothetical protein K2H54_038738, partial [Gekko kuhli]